jgi:hypothetical protein
MSSIIINKTNFKTEEIEEITKTIIDKKYYPNFCLICLSNNFNGVSITNLELPLIVIKIKNLKQFMKVLLHELTHLNQHKKGYVDEIEAEINVEILLSDNENLKGILFKKEI